ncbi:hypothetical protein D3C75_937960 [compost metagenome]
MLETQFLLRSSMGYYTNTGNKTARKNIALDIVHCIQGFRIACIFNGDSLNQGQTIRLEELMTFTEIGRQILFTHGLDHFNRHQLIVFAFQ